MNSYSSLLSRYQEFTNDTQTANQTLGAVYFNDSIRAIASIRGGKWWFLETTKTVATVASQQAYQIPNPIRKIMDLYVTVGTTVYMPTPIEDPGMWKEVLASNLGTSDVPLFYYRQGNQVLLAPTPASSSNTITIRGRLKLRDLSIADYSTGSIVSVANGGTAVVGTGTTWTTSMAGRFIRITESDTDLKGDGFWYEIASVGSTTTLTLTKPYQGTAVAAATAAYVIGQMSVLPEEYDLAPCYRSAALYYQKEGEPEIANQFWRMYDGGKEAGLLSENDPYGGIIGRMMEEAGEKVEGAYLPPLGNSLFIDPNLPPRLASGF